MLEENLTNGHDVKGQQNKKVQRESTISSIEQTFHALQVSTP